MRIRQFVLEGLGHLSCLISDDDAGVAAVVDPRRDVDLYLEAAAADRLRITHVLETHLHNDYVSGARQLSALTGASHVIGAGAALRHEHRPMRDREAVEVGRLRFRVLDTPGHTPEHVVYQVADTRRADDPLLLLTGGSLLAGSVGRSDLLGRDRAVPFARAMYRSLHDVVLPHADHVAVYPTHGAGSLCSTGVSSTPRTTIGFERRHNPLLQPMEVEAFVRALLAGQPAVPRYFARMRPINQAGPSLAGARPPMPPSLPVDEVLAAIAGGALLVDARPARRHAAGHPPGALAIPADPSFGTWLGWVVEPDQPVVLLDDGDEVADDLVRQAWRIGHESIAGRVAGGWAGWVAFGGPVEASPTIHVRELARRLNGGGPDVPLVVDVRQATEYNAGHVPGSWHLMAGWLPGRLAGIPRDRPIVTICASGYRSTIAASLLRRAGFRDVTGVRTGVPDWIDAGLPVERGGADEDGPAAGAGGTAGEGTGGHSHRH
jgi:hydroxyacylglutathione hydrolase